MATAFTKAVAAASRKADKAAIASALGDLVLLKLRNRAVRQLNRVVSRAPTAMQQVQRALADGTLRPDTPAKLGNTAQRRASRSTGRRRGKLQRYVVTAKVDISRLGTFRHYMLRTIREHTDTWSAERAHEQSGQHVGKRLDFGWAAAEGYIEFQ